MKEDSTRKITVVHCDNPEHWPEFRKGVIHGQTSLLLRLVRDGIINAEYAADDMGVTVDELFDSPAGYRKEEWKMKKEKASPVMILWAEGHKPAEIAERLKMPEADVVRTIHDFLEEDPVYWHEYARGFKQGQFLMLRRLVRNGHITAEAAAEDMGMTVEEFFAVTDRLEAQRY